MLTFLSYIGGMYLGWAALIGLYILLRWGSTGVGVLWRHRRAIDTMVLEDVEGTIWGRGRK